MAITRHALFGKLGSTLFKSVESATALCKLRGNPYVELVHWLHQILQLSDSDLHRILRHCEIDPGSLERDMTRALSVLPAGAGSISNFSHHIETAIERAWIFATLGFNDHRVRGAWLMAALVKTPELRHVLLGISPAFRSISVDGLDAALPAWIDGSPEATESAYDRTDFLPASPGEASGALPASPNGSTLEQYCTDLTAQARNGEIDPVIGRELEVRTMIDVLLRRRQNNPLLTGEAGVGKTAVVEGLALAMANGVVPPKLADVRLMSLDVGALLAGASMKGEFEARLRGVLEAATKSPVPVHGSSTLVFLNPGRFGPNAQYSAFLVSDESVSLAGYLPVSAEKVSNSEYRSYSSEAGSVWERTDSLVGGVFSVTNELQLVLRGSVCANKAGEVSDQSTCNGSKIIAHPGRPICVGYKLHKGHLLPASACARLTHLM
jgi:hypothetical protein